MACILCGMPQYCLVRSTYGRWESEADGSDTWSCMHPRHYPLCIVYPCGWAVAFLSIQRRNKH
jgi:hypothetical protein